MRSIFI